MNGDTAVAKILKAEGIEWLACFPAQSLIDACSREGIRPVLCRQERAGVNMADGFSRVTNGRTVGVFTMQHGPGAENAMAGAAQAYADSVPLLLLPGGEARDREGVHPYFNAAKNYEGFTKWTGTTSLASRIPDVMRQAFTHLKHGRLGPVLVEIPTDVAQEEVPESAAAYEPVAKRRSGGDPDDVRDMVRALLAAKRPVVSAGQGVLYAEATDELLEFAELANVPVMTTLAGKSAFPETHRLALGTGGNSGTKMVAHFLEQADFVLGIGTSFTKSNFNAPVPMGATLAQVTVCAEDLNKERAANFGAVGDAKLVLAQMIDEVRWQTGEHGRGDVLGVADEIARVKSAWMAEWGPNLTSNEVPISPYRVIKEMENVVDVRETILTHDSGYPRDQIVPFWPAETPRGYIGWGKSTQLGYGLGLAIGAKLAAPEKNVINLMGDAAFGMSGLDIETAVRSEIGILTVVLNNGVMTNYSNHMPHATEVYGSNALGGNYAGVASELGASAERVSSPDEVAGALRRGLAAASEGRPALVEVMTKEEMNVPKYW